MVLADLVRTRAQGKNVSPAQLSTVRLLVAGDGGGGDVRGQSSAEALNPRCPRGALPCPLCSSAQAGCQRGMSSVDVHLRSTSTGKLLSMITSLV